MMLIVSWGVRTLQPDQGDLDHVDGAILVSRPG